MSRCRSCDAPILWAKTAAGKLMPVDVRPVADGNIVLERDADGQRLARFISPETPADSAEPRPNSPEDVGFRLEAPPDRTPRYTSHFATCPNAGEHRRAR